MAGSPFGGRASAEDRLQDELIRNGPSLPDGSHDDPTQTTWLPPDWLPDSLAKIGPWKSEFDRVAVLLLQSKQSPSGSAGESADADEPQPASPKVLLADQQATDATLAKLPVLHALRALRMSNHSFTDAGLKPLGDLPRLTVLELPDADVTDATLAQIAAIRSLSALSIRCPHATERRCRAAKEVAKLEILAANRCRRRPASRAPERTAAFEGLVLESPTLKRVDLNGFAHLRQFCIGASVGDPDDQFHLDSLRVESLPALASLRLRDIVPATTRLGDLPELVEADICNSTFPIGALRQILALPKLDSLALFFSDIPGSDFVEFDSCKQLRRLEITEINHTLRHPMRCRVANLSSLDDLYLGYNVSLDELELGSLPKLKQITMTCSPRVRTIDLRGAPRLESLRISRGTIGLNTSAGQCLTSADPRAAPTWTAHRFDAQPSADRNSVVGPNRPITELDIAGRKPRRSDRR